MMLIPCAELESSDEGEGDDREEDANKPAGSSSSAGPSATPSAAPRKQQKKTVRKWCPGVQVLRLAYKKAIMPITEAVRAEIMVSALGDVSLRAVGLMKRLLRPMWRQVPAANLRSWRWRNKKLCGVDLYLS